MESHDDSLLSVVENFKLKAFSLDAKLVNVPECRMSQTFETVLQEEKRQEFWCKNTQK